MDGGSVGTKRSTKHNRKFRNSYRAWLKRDGLNEHHRQPRSQNGGRGLSDLNICKVGINIHACFHALFGTLLPSRVCEKINELFVNEDEYLVVVPTKDFSTFHRYFTNRGVLPLGGMASHGLTWGHLFLHGNHEDLNSTFRGGRHFFSKADPEGVMSCRYQYLFTKLQMSVMAFELTRYWMPLSVVIVAVSKLHQAEVSDFLTSIAVVKKKR
jgi:hypothetical protein